MALTAFIQTYVNRDIVSFQKCIDHLCFKNHTEITQHLPIVLPVPSRCFKHETKVIQQRDRWKINFPDLMFFDLFCLPF